MKKTIPLIGLGTWLLGGKACTQAVKDALHLGYRHIDTAFSYDNHKEIGKGIEGFPRDELFITSKLALSQVYVKDIQNSVVKACDKALTELGTEYLDLYLIHAPDRSLPMDAVFEAMHHLIALGKIRAAGVSNFTIHHLQDLLKTKREIWANQVEFHPYLIQKELLNFCNDHGILLISYRPFGKGQLLKEEPLFDTLGKKYNKTGAQIILRWLIQTNIPVVPKATTKKHLQENIDIFNFSLSSEEVALIDSLDKGKRYCMTDWTEFNY